MEPAAQPHLSRHFLRAQVSLLLRSTPQEWTWSHVGLGLAGRVRKGQACRAVAAADMCLCAQPERVAWLPFPPAGPPDERTGVSTAHRLFVIGAYVEDVQACSTCLTGGFSMPLRNIDITPALIAATGSSRCAACCGGTCSQCINMPKLQRWHPRTEPCHRTP